eukprot:CAMPEP_0170185094 /NCGR_PEP_ID=MMETSP0040_2-20121228/35622_1 /TAXON_ID=641309 /ORGANISM="Lotharella oceanica, Strain CCMP622" /LENGTH=124 /DNA_ID=CAMNT_0010431381 /DNA_START=29 /DNA_END=402 /DNA_ORIENTATION=-
MQTPLVFVLVKEGFKDVKKAGGASGANKNPVVKWNTPKEVKAEAVRLKEEEKAAKARAKALKRAQNKTPQAIAITKRKQLEKTKMSLETDLANNSLSPSEFEKLKAKMDRVMNQLADLDQQQQQ